VGAEGWESPDPVADGETRNARQKFEDRDMQIRSGAVGRPGKRAYSRLKWYLSVLSTALTTLFVIALEADF
jgi:hypothetical protein